jgi:succinoglycan biosynthesis transport protein ExoP
MNSQEHANEYIDINFQKYWLVLKRRLIPATAIFVSLVGFSIVYAMSLDKIYQADAKLLIKVDGSGKLTGLENNTGEITGLTTESNPLYTEVEILRSRHIIEKVVQELELKDDLGKPLKYQTIVDALKVIPITGTDILEVSYESTDPELATSIVNKVIDIYVTNNSSSNRSETKSAREFIAKQLPEVKIGVAKAEANLRKFKNQNQIASLTEETTANINSISDVGNQIDKVKAEFKNIEARYNTLELQLNMSWAEASAVSALSQSLAVQKVLEQLQNVKVTLAQKRNFLSDSAPQIVALKEEEADLTALLDVQIAQTLGTEEQTLAKKINILNLGDLKQEQIAEFANLGLQKEGLNKELVALENTYKTYRQKSDSLPILQQQERELENQVEAAQSSYRTLLGRLQETRINEQQNIGNVRVIFEAKVPEEAIGPKKTLIVGTAGVLGGLLSIATAFLLDIRDKTIKNTQEIKQILPYPLSGVIPDYNQIPAEQKQLLLPNGPESSLPKFAVSSTVLLPVREAYHNIQLNLKLFNNQVENKIIIVTSALSEEGKSSVAAHLALAQAQCGKKVLLIDADLRHPSQHIFWEVSNDIGLTNIVDLDIEWFDILHNITPNLDLITSGKTQKHPMSLLNSSFMRTFGVNISNFYDCIIIDTPPLVGLADTKILSNLADGLLFVVRPGQANYKSLMAAKELLSDMDCKVLGVVANAVDLSKDPYGFEYFYADRKYLKAGL